jgi:hypothetical protein
MERSLMSEFLKLDKEERRVALLASQEQHESNLPAYIIEKDYWVTATLRILYLVIAPKYSQESSTPFIFKGGTSLSKCFKVIDRMSEDIDLSLSLKLLDHAPVIKKKSESRKKLQKSANEIQSTAKKFVAEQLLQEVSDELKKLDSSVNITLEDNGLDIGIYYPKALDESDYGSGVFPRVLLETGGLSDDNPTQTVQIQHMLGESITSLDDGTFEVVALAPVRTMLEKMFGVHTNLTQRKELDKYARHLFDVIKLNQMYPDWLQYSGLFFSHVDFSDANYKTHQESCDTARIGPIKLCPDCESMDAHYKSDWEKMSDMFPGGELPYTYDKLIEAVKIIEGKANENFYLKRPLN